MILLHHVHQMVMEKLEMIFAIASKLFACVSFVITLFNVLSIHVTLSLFSVDRIESDKFKIGNKYDSDEDIIRAVIKVQQGHEENLFNDKAKAIAPWKLDPESGEDMLNKQISEFEMMKQAQEKANKRKSAVVSPKSAYDPAIKECGGASAAEAERVWSMAGHVLTDHPSKMSSLIFELV